MKKLLIVIPVLLCFLIARSQDMRKIYVNDNNTVSDVFTTSPGNNSNAGTQAAPVATISYAHSIAQAGDTIIVDAGTFVEQVTVTKNITIRGAGRDLTYLVKPAVTVPPPGSFTEQGVIQTAQNIGDLHVADMSITADHTVGVTPLIIQTGGSVKNCNLQNGNQGIFFRVESAVRSAVVENNLIQATFIGVNFQGSGLTATLANNEIRTVNPGFSAGVFVGLDFGPIPQFTVANNKFISYSTYGIFGGSNNTSIIENSFIGYGSAAIQSFNSADATCNWFGTDDAEIIKSKIVGPVNYAPWLVSGTDINPVTIGFQPGAGTCTGRQNKFYVNDDSQAGDALTSAIGNNANNGFSTAPLATIQYAINQAQAGDTIIVDAGTFVEQVTVTKNITIRGAGRELTYLVKPAATVPPPGPFTEQGVIQTAQNIGDLHVANMSITADHTVGVTPLIIQTGGSVKNCNLQNGNQGIFFRVESDVRSAVVENNIIQAEFIGVNFAGTGLTASLANNEISTTNAGFSAGIFFGTDFGNLPQFTVANNKFISYSTYGIFGGSNNTSIIENSFTGVGSSAIYSFNSANASCNWYGSPLAANITPKITGAVTFSPWLIDGTDASPMVGFQTSAICPIANSFYVNDNNTTGDVFTTAVGNNVNAGTFNAPFATVDYAIAQVPAGATIYVDAGTYVTPDVPINKIIKLLGPNYSTSPNNSSDKLIANTGRNSEAIISGSTFTVSSNDVSLEGIRFEPGAKSQVVLTNTGFNNFSFKKNYSIITSGNFITLTGPTIPNSQTPAFGNHLIEDNRFEKTGTVSGIGVTVGYLNNVTINNNVFVTPAPATQRVLINSYAGFGGVATNFNYTNNTSQASNYDLFSFSLASGLIENNTLLHSQRPLFIQTFSAGSQNVQIRNNYIETDFALASPIRYGGFDGAMTGSTISAVIEGNTVIQNPAGRNSIQTACNAFLSGTAPNTSLTIKRNKFSFIGDYGLLPTSFVSGLSLLGKLQTVFVEDNEIAFNGTNLTTTPPVNAPSSPGIYLNSDGGTANQIPSNAVMNFTGNKITGFKNSIAFYDASSAAPNTYIGFGNLPLGVTVNINNNSFTGDSISINNGAVGEIINCTCNWYGSAAAQHVLPKITISTVNYIPWLNNGTDADPAIGFQPVANACQGQPAYYVNDNSLTGDVFTTATGSNSNSGSSASPFATVDYAVAVAQPGDTIYVDAGDYTIPTFTINKSITILGSNYQVSPNDPTDKTQYNTARNAEARITGGTMIMGADWIIMQGLRFSSNAAITLNGDYSHIKFYKNYFDVASSGNTILLQGASTSPIIAFDFALTHNRFERTDNFTGNALFLGAVKSLWIDNNVFIESGPAVNRSTGIRTATVSTVENIVVSNNYLKKLNNSIITSILNTAVITSNTFDSCAQGVNYMPTGAISSNVTISSNSFINLRQARSVLVRGGSGGGINGLNVINNTINQSVDGINGIVSMIQLEYTAANTFGNTNVQNNIINISGDYNNTSVGMNNGIQLVGKHSNTTIEYNEINFTAVNAGPPVIAGIFPPVPAGIYIATDGSAIYGMIPSTAVLNIRNNKIQGFKTSVAFYDPTSTGTNSNEGYGYLTNGAAVNISNNSFTADSISIDNGTVSQIVTATCNWYGSAAAQNTATKVSASSVNYTPWLTSGTDENPATGFQPIAGTCTGTPPVIAFNSSTSVSCFGGNNGSINITVTGGTTPYHFNWSRNGAGGYSTVEDPANLMAGSYDLLLTDVNGSTASLNALVITEPTLLTATVTGSSTSCFNSASVSASGGTGSYSYLWNNGATTADISNIPPGTYSVVVTDQNNCTVTDSVTVTGNPAFNPSIAVTNVSCFGGADGSLTVTNANGVAPYQYSIDGIQFQNSNVFTRLAAGTYSLTVRDALGCTGFNSKTIAEPTPFSLTLNSVQGTCFGSNTGAVNTSASGGSPSFTYQWSGPNGFTAGNSNISNLATGSYTLTVTDSKGCIATLTVSVPTTPQVLVNSAVTNVQCKGESNGSIAVTVSGGTGSFSYQWSNGANTASISNLGAGNYNLVITDAGSGCSINKSYSISQPSAAINLSATKTNATGCGSLGTINLSGSGGTPPYQYSINGVNFVSSGSFTGLYAGSYNAWVKDASGCTKTLVVSLTDNGGDEYESNNSKNQAKAISIGIVANARLAVSNDPADWFKVVTPAGSGSYTLSLTHPTSSFTYNLYIAGNNTPALVPTSTGTTSKVYTLLGNTTYYISVTGGLSYTCYSLMLAPPTSFTLPIVSERIAGSNSDGNIAQAKITMQEIKTLSVNAYPNPHHKTFNLTIAAPENGIAKIDLFTINGQQLQQKLVRVKAGNQYIVPFTVTRNGTVVYRIQLGKHSVGGKVIGAD